MSVTKNTPLTHIKWNFILLLQYKKIQFWWLYLCSSKMFLLEYTGASYSSGDLRLFLGVLKHDPPPPKKRNTAIIMMILCRHFAIKRYI